MDHQSPLIVHVAGPADISVPVSEWDFPDAFDALLWEALWHYARDPGWYGVDINGVKGYACRLVTLPFLYFIEKRVAHPVLQEKVRRALTRISPEQDAPLPDAWIILPAAFFCPLPRPAEKRAEAKRLTASLKKTAATVREPEAVHVPLSLATSLLKRTAPEVEAGSRPVQSREEKKAPAITRTVDTSLPARKAPAKTRPVDATRSVLKAPERPAPAVEKHTVSNGSPAARGETAEIPAAGKAPAENKIARLKGGEKKNPGRGSVQRDAAVITRINKGEGVKQICAEMRCSEAYVYKVIKREKGMSATDFRWIRWQAISDMYHSVPRKTVDEMEMLLDVSRAQIYHAVKKIAERDNITLSQEKRDRKISDADVDVILEKLSQGVLRKDICAEYGIRIDTLIKYVGTREDHWIIPEEYKDEVVRLRTQGKTIVQTAEILGVNMDFVKKAWREKKDSKEIKKTQLKYDNRNPLTKQDRDNAVNAVLKGGHTQKQIYQQYGINALTLRRYIRAAKKAETDMLRDEEKTTQDDHMDGSE